MSNFIERRQSYEVRYDGIDDFIDEWHENPQGKSLYDFLGMTRKEYSLWLVDASILPTIVTVHSQKRSLDEVLEEVSAHIPDAARTTGPRSTQELIDWLKKQDLFSLGEHKG